MRKSATSQPLVPADATLYLPQLRVVRLILSPVWRDAPIALSCLLRKREDCGARIVLFVASRLACERRRRAFVLVFSSQSVVGQMDSFDIKPSARPGVASLPPLRWSYRRTPALLDSDRLLYYVSPSTRTYWRLQGLDSSRLRY